MVVGRGNLGAVVAVVLGSFRSRDGLWRVVVIKERGMQWAQLYHGEHLLEDKLVIGTLDYYLHQHGIDWADLVEE